MNNSDINLDSKFTFDLSDDESCFEVPKRKPIGWNYQNVFNPSSNEQKINGISPPKTDVSSFKTSDTTNIKKNDIILPTKKDLNYPIKREPICLTLSESLSPTQSESLSPTQSKTVTPTQSKTVSPTQSKTVSPTQRDHVSPTQRDHVSPLQGDPICPTQKDPICPTQRKPICPTQKNPICPTQKNPICPTQKNPICPTQKNPICPTQKNPICPTQKNTICPTQKNTICPTQKNPICPTQWKPICPTQKDPTCPTQRKLTCPTQKDPTCPTQRKPTCPAQKDPTCPTQRNPICPTQKDPTCPTQRKLTYPTQRDPISPTKTEAICPTKREPIFNLTIEPTCFPKREPICTLKREPICTMTIEPICPPKREPICPPTRESISSKKSEPIKRHDSTDDIEVLEVLEVKKISAKPVPSSKSLFPPSSTKQEIKDITRNISQQNIKRFFPVTAQLPKLEPPPVASTSSDKNQSSHNKSKSTSPSQLNGHEQGLACRLGQEVKEPEPDITSEHSRCVVEKFIEKWKKVQSFSKDDEKIKEKIWKNYYLCHTTYIHSRKFVNGLKKGTENLNEKNLYVFISDIIENLKRYKDIPYYEKKKKSDNQTGETSSDQNEEILDKEELTRRRKMARVEKELIKLSQKINKLETAEVDLDDDVNSSYLILERLKNQFVKLDELYCKLAECATSTGRPVEKKFKYEGSRYPEINKRITAWVNKNRSFPEYMDVLDLVKNVTKRNDLPLRPESIRVQAQDIFRDVGRILKERRERDDLFSIYAYADASLLAEDPAEEDHDLRRKLKDNEKDAKDKLDKVFQFFVDKDMKIKEKEEKKKDPKKKEEETSKEEEEAAMEEENLEVEANAFDDDDDDDDEEEEEEEEEEDDDEEEEVEEVEEEKSKEEEKKREEGDSMDLPSMELSPNDSDSDSDIQEILMAPLRHEEEEEEEDEEEEGPFIEEYNDERFTDEDVEIALSPSPSSMDENKNEMDCPVVLAACNLAPLKRKINPFSSSDFISRPETKRIRHDEPEIVELD